MVDIEGWKGFVVNKLCMDAEHLYGLKMNAMIWK